MSGAFVDVSLEIKKVQAAVVLVQNVARVEDEPLDIPQALSEQSEDIHGWVREIALEALYATVRELEQSFERQNAAVVAAVVAKGRAAHEAVPGIVSLDKHRPRKARA